MKAQASKEWEVLFFPNKSNEQKVIDFIKLAKKELKICVFTFTNQNIAMAILNKVVNEKVKVRIITDDVQNEGKYSICDVLQGASDDLIKFRTDLRKDAHMHHKYVVVDDKFIATGSFNWTAAAVTKNNENLLLIQKQDIAKEYSKNFEELWDQFKSTEIALSKLSSDIKQRAVALKNKLGKGDSQGQKPANNRGRKKADQQKENEKQNAGDLIIEQEEEEDEDQVKRSKKTNGQQQQPQDSNGNQTPSQKQNGDKTPRKRGPRARKQTGEEDEELLQKKENVKKQKKIKKLMKMSKITEVKRVILQSKVAQSRFQRFKNVIYNAASFALGALSLGSYLYLSQTQI